MVVLDNFVRSCYGKQTRETLQTEHATERVPTLDFPFKLAYNIAAYGLMYGLLVFENWRVENSRVDWKALCKEEELSKK